MEAKVVSINGNYVQVESAIGTFSGIWCDGNPVKNRTYFLELDCPENILKQQVQSADTDRYSIRQDDGKIELTGKVEAIEDSILVFRIGPSLIMIETKFPADFYDYLGKFVSISLQKVNLYDIGIQS